MKKIHNLAILDEVVLQQMQIDMKAASIAYLEKYEQPINMIEVRKSIIPEMLDFFTTRLTHHRALSQSLGRLDSIED